LGKRGVLFPSPIAFDTKSPFLLRVVTIRVYWRRRESPSFPFFVAELNRTKSRLGSSFGILLLPLLRMRLPFLPPFLSPVKGTGPLFLKQNICRTLFSYRDAEIEAPFSPFPFFFSHLDSMGTFHRPRRSELAGTQLFSPSLLLRPKRPCVDDFRSRGNGFFFRKHGYDQFSAKPKHVLS